MGKPVGEIGCVCPCPSTFFGPGGWTRLVSRKSRCQKEPSWQPPTGCVVFEGTLVAIEAERKKTSLRGPSQKQTPKWTMATSGYFGTSPRGQPNAPSSPGKRRPRHARRRRPQKRCQSCLAAPRAFQGPRKKECPSRRKRRGKSISKVV